MRRFLCLCPKQGPLYYDKLALVQSLRFCINVNYQEVIKLIRLKLGSIIDNWQITGGFIILEFSSWILRDRKLHRACITNEEIHSL